MFLFNHLQRVILVIIIIFLLQHKAYSFTEFVPNYTKPDKKPENTFSNKYSDFLYKSNYSPKNTFQNTPKISKYQKINNKYNYDNEVIVELKKQLREEEERSSKLYKENKNLKETINNLMQQIDKNKALREEEKNSKLSKENKNLKERVNNLMQQVNEQEKINKFDMVFNENKNLKKTIDNLNKEMEINKCKLIEANGQLNIEINENNNLKKTIDELNMEIENNKNKFKEMTDKLNKEINEKHNLKEINDKLNMEIKSKNNNNKLIEANDKLNMEINEKNNLQKTIDKLNTEINELKEYKNIKETLIPILNQLKDLKEENIKLKIESNKAKSAKEKLENDLVQKNTELQNLLSQQNKNNYRGGDTPIQRDDKIFVVNFTSMGINNLENYNLICKNKDLFVSLEERLYNDFPQFKQYETYFVVNGKKIKRFQTLEQNEIKMNDLINIFTIEE